MNQTSITPPYLHFLGDAPDELAAKTAYGVHAWRPEWSVGQYRLDGCNADLGIADMSIAQAAEAGARTVLLGVANRGGVIPENWSDALVEALDLGMDIASGLHTKVADIDVIRAAAERNGRSLHDVRHPAGPFRVASGEARSGNRVLAVGTDCSVGKMYTTLAIDRCLKARGVASARSSTTP